MRLFNPEPAPLNPTICRVKTVSGETVAMDFTPHPSSVMIAAGQVSPRVGAGSATAKVE